MVRQRVASTTTNHLRTDALVMSEDDEEAVPDWAKTAFWALVLVFNVAVFFTAVSVMVFYFEDDVTLSAAMFAIGMIAWVAGIGGYIMTQRRLP